MDDVPPELPLATLEYAPPDPSRSPWTWRLAWVTIAILWMGWACIGTISAETTLASGPALAVVSIVLIIRAIKSGQLALCFVGIGHLCLCGLLVGLVNALNLSPKRSVIPFLMFGAVWAAIATVVTVLHRSLEGIRLIRHPDGVTLHVPFSLRR